MLQPAKASPSIPATFDGLPTAEFKQKITAWLAEQGLGQRKVNFKLRDWLFSRQRYWGEPFPILHEIDAAGQPTGVVRPLDAERPAAVPAGVDDYQPERQARSRRWARRPTGST